MLSAVKLIKYKPQPDEYFDCENIVEALREEFYDQVKSAVESDEDFEQKTDCIIEKLRTFNLGDVYLEKYIYVNDEAMSILKRNRAVSDAIVKIEQKLELAEEICAPKKMFGDWFDESHDETLIANEIESGEKDEFQLQEDYCQIQRLIESKTIDTKVYNVTLNPKNIETVSLKCDKIWAESTQEHVLGLKEEFAVGLNQPSNKEVRCFMDTINRGNYSEVLMKVYWFNEIRLTKAQRIAERSSFIDFLTNLYANILKCQKSK